MNDVASGLPNVRGKIRRNAPLAPTVWFQTGGAASILFRPADADDLCDFIKEYSGELPVIPLGLGSNTLIRDGGLKAVVVRLGKGFTQAERIDDARIYFGAGVPAATAAKFAANEGLTGAEFMIGIPGALGGLLKMNAGAYDGDMASIVEYVDVVTEKGEKKRLSCSDMGYSYRHSALPNAYICVGACLRLSSGSKEKSLAAMADYMAKRESSQPVKGRTGGSTFKNPDGDKAWRLIDAAGCRGLRIGGAQMSELHCNFLLNIDAATASDVENLGEEVKRRVYEHSGVMLEWEIKRLGDFV